MNQQKSMGHMGNDKSAWFKEVNGWGYYDSMLLEWKQLSSTSFTLSLIRSFGELIRRGEEEQVAQDGNKTLAINRRMTPLALFNCNWRRNWLCLVDSRKWLEKQPCNLLVGRIQIEVKWRKALAQQDIGRQRTSNAKYFRVCMCIKESM